LLHFIDIANLTRKEKKIAKEIDDYRNFYNLIELVEYFEPVLLTEINNTKKTDKMSLIISEPGDINCWILGLSQNCIVKMKNLEEAVVTLMNKGDLYSAAILIRHHMELAGLICLALEVLRDGDNEKLQRFISKTFYGASYYNNPRLRESDDAFFRTETPTVSAMIRALDSFLKLNSENKLDENLCAHNYAFFSQFSHPSFDSSSFFVDSRKLEQGHTIQFRWKPNYGQTGVYSTLTALKQNLQIGLASYFIFTAYHFTHEKVYCNEDNIAISYEILTGKNPE